MCMCAYHYCSNANGMYLDIMCLRVLYLCMPCRTFSIAMNCTSVLRTCRDVYFQRKESVPILR